MNSDLLPPIPRCPFLCQVFRNKNTHSQRKHPPGFFSFSIHFSKWRTWLLTIVIGWNHSANFRKPFFFHCFVIFSLGSTGTLRPFSHDHFPCLLVSLHLTAQLYEASSLGSGFSPVSSQPPLPSGIMVRLQASADVRRCSRAFLGSWRS